MKRRRTTLSGMGATRLGPSRGWPLGRKLLWFTLPTTPKGLALLAAKWGAIVGLASAALVALVVTAMFLIYGADLREFKSLRDYQPDQVVRIAAADGVVVGEIYSQRRTVVSFSELPEVLVQALVSAEDAGFWQHEGIDYWGMLRAVFVNLKEGGKKQGASTITQQVVKNLLLSRERSFRRKVQEIILARRLEKHLSKEEIITLYANEIFFGHGRYGVKEAARYYFDKDLAELSLGEAALLAGLPKSANNYSPKKPGNAVRAKSRQIYVLKQMVENGYVTAAEAQPWIDQPIRVVDQASNLGTAPDWVALALSELKSRYDDQEIDRLGTTVTTTLDRRIQETATTALRNALHRYDQRKGYGHKFSSVAIDKIPLQVAILKRRRKGRAPSQGEVHEAVVLKIHDKQQELLVDLGGYQAALLLAGPADERFNPANKKPSKRFDPGDQIRVVLGAEPGVDRKSIIATNLVHFAPGPEGAVVVIDPHTRQLKALAGGSHQRVGDFNRATSAKRQAGSTFKPFVYAAAIESGEFTAASLINDAPEVYDLWKPENYNKGEFLGPVRLRLALAKSINSVAIKVTNDIGPGRVRELANVAGIKTELPNEMSLALGSGVVTPLELTNAFATFAAAGKYAPVQTVMKIGDTALETVEPRQALPAEVAYVVTDMMKSVVSEGTGAGAAHLGLDLAGKTGTSNDAKDAWFVGMTQDLVVGVWVGFDDFRRGLGAGEGGSKTALPAVVEIMAKLGKKSSQFVRPDNVVAVRIDKNSGLLAPEGVDDNVYEEVFIEGTAPVEFAPAPGEIGVDDAVLDQYGGAPPPSPDAAASSPDGSAKNPTDDVATP